MTKPKGAARARPFAEAPTRNCGLETRGAAVAALQPEGSTNLSLIEERMTKTTAIAIGIAIGATMGVAMDNIAMGIGIGIAIGIAMSLAAKGEDDK
jgi:F420-0:gamma-glutamyl ligase